MVHHSVCYHTCFQIRPDWAKGHAHVGQCKLRLGDIEASIAAYRKAQELEPKTEYSKAVEMAKTELRRRQTTSGPSIGIVGGRVAKALQVLLWLFMFANALAYLIPFGPRRSLRPFVLATAGSALSGLFQTHGRPVPSQAYLSKFLADSRAHRIMSAFLLFLGPNVLLLIALLIPETASMASTLVVGRRFGTHLFCFVCFLIGQSSLLGGGGGGRR